MRISDWSSDVCSSDLPKFGSSASNAAIKASLSVIFESVVEIRRRVVVGQRRRDVELRTVARFEQSLDFIAGVSRHCLKQSPGSSEERRVGKASVSTCRFRWSPDRSKKEKNTKT